jgi:ribonuclease P protein component
LKQRHRLRGSAAFAAVFRSGRRFEGSRLQLLARSTSNAATRVGFVIGKKLLGRAVDRNRLKRMLREHVRNRRSALEGFDLIVRLREPCPPAEIAAAAAELKALLDTLQSARRS